MPTRGKLASTTPAPNARVHGLEMLGVQVDKDATVPAVGIDLNKPNRKRKLNRGILRRANDPADSTAATSSKRSGKGKASAATSTSSKKKIATTTTFSRTTPSDKKATIKTGAGKTSSATAKAMYDALKKKKAVVPRGKRKQPDTPSAPKDYSAKKHKCSHCEYRSDHRGNLKMHERTHAHVGAKYKCLLCDFAGRQKVHLTNHMTTHTGERPYMCKVCSKSFAQPTTLKYHSRSHTGERPYSCENCEYRATRKSHLVSHQKLHKPKENGSWEEMLTCMHLPCVARFNSKGSLTKHINAAHLIPQRPPPVLPQQQ